MIPLSGDRIHNVAGVCGGATLYTGQFGTRLCDALIFLAGRLDRTREWRNQKSDQIGHPALGAPLAITNEAPGWADSLVPVPEMPGAAQEVQANDGRTWVVA